MNMNKLYFLQVSRKKYSTACNLSKVKYILSVISNITCINLVNFCAYRSNIPTRMAAIDSLAGCLRSPSSPTSAAYLHSQRWRPRQKLHRKRFKTWSPTSMSTGSETPTAPPPPSSWSVFMQAVRTNNDVAG